jgi:hypothetical protein
MVKASEPTKKASATSKPTKTHDSQPQGMTIRANADQSEKKATTQPKKKP